MKALRHSTRDIEFWVLGEIESQLTVVVSNSTGEFATGGVEEHSHRFHGLRGKYELVGFCRMLLPVIVTEHDLFRTLIPVEFDTDRFSVGA